MAKQDKNIEDLFAGAFRDSEATPPSNLWDTIDASLDSSPTVENIYKSSFTNAKISPSSNIWRKIAVVLFFQNFITFKFNTFNVYYAALAVFGVGAHLYMQSTPEQVTQIMHTAKFESIAEQLPVGGTASSEYANNTTEKAATTLPVSDAQIATDSRNVTNLKNQSANAIVQKTSTTPQNKMGGKAMAVDYLKNAKISGKTALCASDAAEYVLENVPAHAQVEWDLVQKNGFARFISKQKIVSSWNKSGAYTIRAEVRVDNTSKVLELPVKVELAESPIIKGKSKVCEGKEKYMYSVTEPVNNSITYDWFAKNNKIDYSGNKYININWTKVGVDTITVIRKNKASGCVTKAVLPIKVNSKPTVDFDMEHNGNNEYEFSYVGNVKKPQSLTWYIEGDTYNKPVVIHENTGVGNTLVKLEVKDNNGCVSSIQKEVSFGKYILFVPKIWNMNEQESFMPQTNNNLQSYRIEIYNEKNMRIWQSTELRNGRPAESWDGTYKGVQVSRGKYHWKITATFEDGTTWKGVKQSTGELKPSGIIIIEN